MTFVISPPRSWRARALTSGPSPGGSDTPIPQSRFAPTLTSWRQPIGTPPPLWVAPLWVHQLLLEPFFCRQSSPRAERVCAWTATSASAGTHETGCSIFRLDVSDVQQALASAEVVEEYDDECELLLGRSGIQALHLVVRRLEEFTFVITVYVPDPARWDPSFRRRMRQ
jgi:hypothetical protein